MDDFSIARNNTADTLGTRSAQTYVYADSDTKEVTIVVINTYLGEIVGLDDGEVSVTVYDAGLETGREDELYYGVNVSGTYDYETSDFGEDQFVLVTVAGGEVQSMEAADSVIGVMDASASSYLVIDGETYYKSDTYGELDSSEAGSGDYDSTFVFYLDQNGYVLGSELYEEADADYSSYIYIDGSEISINSLTGASAQISVQYLDGSSDILDLYVVENTTDDNYSYYLNGSRVVLDGDDNNSKTEAADDGDEVYGLEGFYR